VIVFNVYGVKTSGKGILKLAGLNLGLAH